MKRKLVTFVVIYAILITAWVIWKSYGQYEIEVIWKDSAKATLESFIASLQSSQNSRPGQSHPDLRGVEIEKLKLHLKKCCTRMVPVKWDASDAHHSSLWLIETGDGERFLLTLLNTSPRSWDRFYSTGPKYEIIKIE